MTDPHSIARFAALILTGPELEAWACRATGMSYHQAADYLGVGRSTVRRRTLRAISKIEAHIAKEQTDGS